ncbi:ABC transporter ATP-binding protein [Caulobacter mirabilis]|uniref:ABC transporter ATP-binding protein n=1 Tax=Caulobacter mirabilis TaxID=69666 RepID=A0A2D2AX27_9CAUL|nr:ABC transporter ATP-binding protein [Caulobacter mirabilis]ATQ42580.1 ABC transporter ATP-binding protein [Caulobacter mirabilis]
MSYALEAATVSKAFGTVKALDGLSLKAPRGGIYGVLGPNGAGKSTLFRIVLGLVRPTSGETRLLGAPAGDIGALRRIGAVIETPRFLPWLTARDTLRMLARASGQEAPEIDRWLARVGLTEAADRKVHGFSVGMKQRLALAAALLTQPELLILDEPTSGMDPAGILEMRTLMRELADKDGVTIILASHQLDEVQRVCDRVAILDRGKLVGEGGVDQLTAVHERLRLTAAPIAKVLETLGERGAPDGDGAVLATVTRAEAPGLIRALATSGVDIVEARWIGGDLETVFLNLTGDAADAR